MLFYNTPSTAYVIVYFKVLSQDMPGAPKERVKNLSEYLSSVPRLEPWIFRISILCAEIGTLDIQNHSTVALCCSGFYSDGFPFNHGSGTTFLCFLLFGSLALHKRANGLISLYCTSVCVCACVCVCVSLCVCMCVCLCV